MSKGCPDASLVVHAAPLDPASLAAQHGSLLIRTMPEDPVPQFFQVPWCRAKPETISLNAEFIDTSGMR